MSYISHYEYQDEYYYNGGALPRLDDGLVFSSNLIWLSSGIDRDHELALIGFFRRSSTSCGRQSVLVTAFGALAMLAGF